MSTDAIGVAFGRDDATDAARMPQIAAESSNELTGIATAIERVEALLTACGGLAPEGADAVERIADIAFVLHERDVEASLCDALDAAVRELSNANVVKRTNVQHVRQAAELLRELSLRVADMIALLQVSSPPPAADEGATAGAASAEGEAAPGGLQASEDDLDSETLDGEILAGEIPREGLFAAALLEDEEFARAVAELAASLPALAEPIEAVVVALHKPAELAAEKTALAPELEEAAARELREAIDLSADESAPASESEVAVTDAGHGGADLATSEALLTHEPEEAIAETQHERAHLVVEEPEPEEAITEVRCEPADVAVEEPAPEALAAIEQTPTEGPPLAEIAASIAALEEPKDEAVPNATLLGEDALSETLSAETPLESAELPGISPDDTLSGTHAAAVTPEADAAPVPAETPSTPGPVEAAENEISVAPDELSVVAPDAELELAPGEAPSPPTDIAGSVAEPPPDQVMAYHNGGDGPVHMADESTTRDVDNAGAATAAAIDEEPTPPDVSESSQSLLPELALVDPQDDPGDLFEPLTDAAPPIAAAKLAAPQGAKEISATVTTRTHFAAAATDPLAAMRALSAEELLALFT